MVDRPARCVAWTSHYDSVWWVRCRFENRLASSSDEPLSSRSDTPRVSAVHRYLSHCARRDELWDSSWVSLQRNELKLFNKRSELVPHVVAMLQQLKLSGPKSIIVWTNKLRENWKKFVSLPAVTTHLQSFTFSATWRKNRKEMLFNIYERPSHHQQNKSFHADERLLELDRVKHCKISQLMLFAVILCTAHLFDSRAPPQLSFFVRNPVLMMAACHGCEPNTVEWPPTIRFDRV